MSWLEGFMAGLRQPRTEADRLLRQGMDHYFIADFRAASESSRAALDLYRRDSNDQGEAVTLNLLGQLQQIQGDPRGAIDLLQQNLTLARKLRDPGYVAMALGELATAHVALGQFKRAVDLFRQQLAIAEERGDEPNMELALGNLGETFYRWGRYDESIEHLERAVELDRRLGQRGLEAKGLGSLGLVHQGTGNFGASSELFQQAREIAKEIEDPRLESVFLMNLGNSYQLLGEETALRYHEEAVEIARQLDDRQSLGGMLVNLGNAQLFHGHIDAARDRYQEALVFSEQDPRMAATALSNLGKAALLAGDPAEALRFMDRSLDLRREIDDRRGIVYSSILKGIAACDLGDFQGSLELLEQAEKLARDLGDSFAEGGALNELGRVLLRSGEPAGSEAVLLRATGIWDSMRRELGAADAHKVSLFDRQAQTYQLLQRSLVAQGKTEAALAVAEQGRARALVDLLSRRFHSGGRDLEADSLSIEEIRQTAKAQNATLVVYSLLREFVEPEAGPGRDIGLLTWVVQPTGRIDPHQHLFSEEGLERTPTALVEESRRAGQVDRDWTQRRQGADLQLEAQYDLLIRPIAHLLPEDPEASVIFIPQHALSMVPFAALWDGKSYLVEKHTISIAPSIQVLDLARRRAARVQGRGRGALVVGNPRMPKRARWPGGPVWTDLPAAEEEAREISRLLGCAPLLRDEATKERVLREMPGRRILHLAAHGLLDDPQQVDIPGAILLAGETEEEALLRAGEVVDLQLDAELAVLSACNTGQGRVRSEGIIGLSRAFLSAGVPSTLVSLWSVPDAPTAQLMSRFYKELGNGKARALRRAMLETRKHHPDPIAWAGFVLIGDPA